MAVLVNPTNPAIAEPTANELRAAARTLGLELHVLHASSESEIDSAFATLAQLRAGGLAIAPDVFFGSRLQRLGALTLRHAVPAIHQFRAFAVAGGLGVKVATATIARMSRNEEDRLAELAADLVRRRVSLIAASESTGAAPRRPNQFRFRSWHGARAAQVPACGLPPVARSQ